MLRSYKNVKKFLDKKIQIEIILAFDGVFYYSNIKIVLTKAHILYILYIYNIL